ncbi:hypothetical protein pEaSNUABM37_00303 [Erwinia phage pEa_SNUABM_37]|nr:hypothetical protein pEaSNUABM37_00303 [Erwinia phage pEa_SNUABM_37]QXO10771.1 hypothetical protein pEaSNUABM48_00303 [Erwinia phage pEa_SNUABM_48]
MEAIPQALISDVCPEGVLVYINKDHFVLVKGSTNGRPTETVLGAVLLSTTPAKEGETKDAVSFPLQRDPNTYLYIVGNEFPDSRCLAIWDMIFDNLDKYLAIKGYR